MRKKRKRRTATRNLLFIGFLVALLAISVTVVQFFVSDPPVILDEDRDAIKAMRASEDNAYFVLVKSLDMLPQVKPPPAPKDAASLDPYGPPATMNLQLPSDSVEFQDILAKCEPAVQHARSALEKPCFLFPKASTFAYGPSDRSFYFLLRAMNATGANLGRTQGRAGEGIPFLIDALRLIRLLYASEERTGALGIHSAVLLQIRLMAKEAEDVRDLDALGTAMEKLGAPFPDRQAILATRWRQFDDTLLDPPLTEFNQFPQVFIMRLFYWRLSGCSRRIIERRSTYDRIVDLHNAEASARIEGLPEGTSPEDHWLSANRIVLRILREVEWAEASYQATRIAIALEWHKRVHETYPKTLAALVPEPMAALPLDPLTGKDLCYRLEGEGYVLYSVGDDGEDDGGKVPRGSAKSLARRHRRHVPPDHILLSPGQP